MRIARLKTKNFREIASSELLLPPHGVLVDDNNTGKSTVLEAIERARPREALPPVIACQALAKRTRLGRLFASSVARPNCVRIPPRLHSICWWLTRYLA